MTLVSITELKARLSHYLREVRRGGEVQILERGRPIALLVGVPATGDENNLGRQRLIRAGILRAGGGDTQSVLAVAPLKVPEGLSGALADDRADRIQRNVRFWDASAVVPLVVEEPATQRVRGWLRDDPEMVTWGWTRVEIASAVERRVREGAIDRAQRRRLLNEFDSLAREWDEVTDLVAVRAKAESLLARHPLRAADAGQLGAALLVAGEDPGILFLCLDERLETAAELEGLRIPSPSA